MQCHIGVIEQQETVDDRIARVKGSARLPVPYPSANGQAGFLICKFVQERRNLFFLSLAPIPSPFSPSPLPVSMPLVRATL